MQEFNDIFDFLHSAHPALYDESGYVNWHVNSPSSSEVNRYMRHFRFFKSVERKMISWVSLIHRVNHCEAIKIMLNEACAELESNNDNPELLMYGMQELFDNAIRIWCEKRDESFIPLHVEENFVWSLHYVEVLINEGLFHRIAFLPPVELYRILVSVYGAMYTPMAFKNYFKKFVDMLRDSDVDYEYVTSEEMCSWLKEELNGI